MLRVAHGMALFSSKTNPIPSACVTVFRKGILNQPSKNTQQQGSNSLEILLVKRLLPPKNGFWAIPGGKFDPLLDKTLMDTAKRELLEETNLVAEIETEYYHKHTAGEGRYLLHHFLAITPIDEDDNVHLSTAKATSDAADICWINVDKIINREWTEPIVDELPGVLEIAKKHFLSRKTL